MPKNKNKKSPASNNPTTGSLMELSRKLWAVTEPETDQIMGIVCDYFQLGDLCSTRTLKSVNISFDETSKRLL